LHPIRDSPLGLYSANLEATGPVTKSRQLAHSPFRVLHAVCAVLLADEPGEQRALALKER